MRLRRPRFALVLTALAAAALMVVFAGRTSTIHAPTIDVGPIRACEAGHAAAVATVRSAIVIDATAAAPVMVTEHVAGPRGIAVITRSAKTAAHAVVTGPIVVARSHVASARACTAAGSWASARALALRIAYAHALAKAHASASRAAATSLGQVMRRLYPTVAAKARAEASARANELALSLRSSLSAQARADAVKQVGG